MQSAIVDCNETCVLRVCSVGPHLEPAQAGGGDAVELLHGRCGLWRCALQQRHARERPEVRPQPARVRSICGPCIGQRHPSLQSLVYFDYKQLKYV